MSEALAPLTSRKIAIAADLALVQTAIFWGVSFALIKEALDSTSPANLLFLRFGIALLILTPVALFKLKSLDREVIDPGLICGCFLMGSLMVQAFGLVYTSATRSGFITGLNVILVPILAIFIFRKLPSIPAMIGAVLALAGLFVLTTADQTQQLPFNRGDVLTMLCALLIAGHILALGYYAPGRDAFWLTWFQLAAATAGAFAWACLTGEIDLSLPPRIYGQITFLSFTGTVLAFLTQSWAQRHTTPTKTAAIFTLESVFAALFAWWYLSETIGTWELVGGGLIVTGILLTGLKPKT